MIGKIFCLLLVSSILNPSQLTYFVIEEETLTPDPIHIRFLNLIESEWYKFNWTDSKDGISFNYDPDSTGYFQLEVTVPNPDEELAFVFELYNLTENETFMESQMLFWSEMPSSNNGGGFKFPDVIGFLQGIPLIVYLMIPVIITLLLIFDYMFRRGR